MTIKVILTHFSLFISFFLTDSLQRLIAQTMVRWGEETFISDQNLVREMFSLLHRQYDGVAEVSICTIGQ